MYFLIGIITIKNLQIKYIFKAYQNRFHKSNHNQRENQGPRPLYGAEWHVYCTARSERSDISYFPIKCIHNLNFLNRKMMKYSEMHTIYLFIHILTETARIDHLVNQYNEQLIFCCAAPFFSKLLHRYSLQIC